MGLADFAGSKFQRIANWPSFDFFFETGRIARNGRLFRRSIIISASTFLSKAGQLAIHWNSSLRPIPLDSSRKLISSSMREKGTFFNVPGRKSLPKP